MKVKEIIKRPLYRIYERRILQHLDRSALPRHIGVIHDGHRRYAREERLPDYAASYRVGMDKFVEFLQWADELEIDAVTCWLLSVENLKRPAEELEPYFDVLIELFERIPDAVAGHSVQVRFIGSLDLLPSRLVEAAKQLQEACPTGKRRVTIALAYAGRQEIVDAAKELVAEAARRQRRPADVVAPDRRRGLGQPHVCRRPSGPGPRDPHVGEARLSGFLLWQSAYAEYSFVDVFWPAFRRVDFLRALRDFTQRERRFGR